MHRNKSGALNKVANLDRSARSASAVRVLISISYHMIYVTSYLKTFTLVEFVVTEEMFHVNRKGRKRTFLIFLRNSRFVEIYRLNSYNCVST